MTSPREFWLANEVNGGTGDGKDARGEADLAAAEAAVNHARRALDLARSTASTAVQARLEERLQLAEQVRDEAAQIPFRRLNDRIDDFLEEQR